MPKNYSMHYGVLVNLGDDFLDDSNEWSFPAFVKLKDPSLAKETEALMEYRFSPSFGLYFTPGVEYHFDNGAEVRSAYTEKPLHWNVNLGVRFHFGN